MISIFFVSNARIYLDFQTSNTEMNSPAGYARKILLMLFSILPNEKTN
jgi:hypothetical protein